MFPVICMSPFKKSLLGICCALHIKQSWLLGTAQKLPLVMSASCSHQPVFLLGCHTSHRPSSLHLCWSCFLPEIKPSFCSHTCTSPFPSFMVHLPQQPCPVHTNTLLWNTAVVTTPQQFAICCDLPSASCRHWMEAFWALWQEWGESA